MPGEFGVGLFGAFKIDAIAFNCGYRHLKYIFKKMGRVRIFFGIAVGMVLAVHQGIGAWVKKRGAFEKVCHEIKNAFPKLVGGEHAVRGITMLKEGLKKQRQEPMGNKKNKYDHYK